MITNKTIYLIVNFRHFEPSNILSHIISNKELLLNNINYNNKTIYIMLLFLLFYQLNLYKKILFSSYSYLRFVVHFLVSK